MTGQPCAGRSYDSWGFGRFVDCSVNAKYEEGGKFWCGHHQPSKVAAKKEKREAIYKAGRDLATKRGERRTHRLGALDNIRVSTDIPGTVRELLGTDDKLTKEVKELEKKLKELEK